MTPKLLSETPSEIGSDRATSLVLPGYEGRCAVIASGDGRIVAVLPSVEEACRVARYAIRPDGGYGSVWVEPTTEPVTSSSLESWL